MDGAAVLFVCTGNICRSPTAEAVFRRKASEAGLHDRIRAESAGTHGFHLGSAPDPRAHRAAGHRGYDLGRIRARRVQDLDCATFDYLIAMDRSHLRALRARCPDHQRIHLLLDYHPTTSVREVPDPYYGGPDGFERVLDLIEASCGGLLQDVSARLAGR